MSNTAPPLGHKSMAITEKFPILPCTYPVRGVVGDYIDKCITIVEHNTRKYHKFIAEYCYEWLLHGRSTMVIMILLYGKPDQ